MSTEVSPNRKRKLTEQNEDDEDESFTEADLKKIKTIITATSTTSTSSTSSNDTNGSSSSSNENKEEENKENVVKANIIVDKPKKPADTSKSMVQAKLGSFFKTNVNSSPKPAETKKVTSAPPEPVVKRANGEWLIEDYLVDEEWRKLLKDEFDKPYFKKINEFIHDGYQKNINRPPKELVFNALNSTKLSKIKVVIIGQDPYHNDGQAHGLSFSVPKGKALPPSLINIFKELATDIPDFKRDESLGGCLQSWADQGVFLLNTFLTVEAHKAGSHSKIGWDTFTDSIIKLISSKNSGCVFFLWGRFAQQKEPLIDKKVHKVLKCAHPSPFSATKFFGNKCFSAANAYLKSINKQPINWSLKSL